ncbi:MAG: hypothetical protein ABL886_05685 [Rhodoglobus sp.]
MTTSSDPTISLTIGGDNDETIRAMADRLADMTTAAQLADMTTAARLVLDEFETADHLLSITVTEVGRLRRGIEAMQRQAHRTAPAFGPNWAIVQAATELLADTDLTITEPGEPE